MCGKQRALFQPIIKNCLPRTSSISTPRAPSEPEKYKLSNGVLKSRNVVVAAKLCLERLFWPGLPKRGVIKWWGRPETYGMICSFDSSSLHSASSSSANCCNFVYVCSCNISAITCSCSDDQTGVKKIREALKECNQRLGPPGENTGPNGQLLKTIDDFIDVLLTPSCKVRVHAQLA